MVKRQIKPLNTLIYIAMFLVLAVFMYVLLIPHRYAAEHFITSRSLYKNINDVKMFDQELKKSITFIEDRSDMLIMQGCYQLAPMERSVFTRGMVYGYFDGYFQDFNIVRNKIAESLQKIKRNKLNNTPIAGPVYALIEQAQNMTDANGNVITMQYNASSYGQAPYNVMTDGAKAEKIKKMGPYYFRIWLLFPAYDWSKRFDKDGIYDPKNSKNQTLQTATRVNSMMNTASQYRSQKDQCFIKCRNDSTTFCGCITRNKNNKKGVLTKEIDPVLKSQYSNVLAETSFNDKITSVATRAAVDSVIKSANWKTKSEVEKRIEIASIANGPNFYNSECSAPDIGSSDTSSSKPHDFVVLYKINKDAAPINGDNLILDCV